MVLYYLIFSCICMCNAVCSKCKCTYEYCLLNFMCLLQLQFCSYSPSWLAGSSSTALVPTASSSSCSSCCTLRTGTKAFVSHTKCDTSSAICYTSTFISNYTTWTSLVQSYSCISALISCCWYCKYSQSKFTSYCSCIVGPHYIKHPFRTQ